MNEEDFYSVRSMLNEGAPGTRLFDLIKLKRATSDEGFGKSKKDMLMKAIRGEKPHAHWRGYILSKDTETPLGEFEELYGSYFPDDSFERYFYGALYLKLYSDKSSPRLFVNIHDGKNPIAKFYMVEKTKAK